MIFYLLTFVVCGGYVLLMVCYLYGWSLTPAVVSSAINHQPSTMVSIILPARNEEKSILNILLCLQRQNYPKDKFEIIIVDDHSEDGTVSLVKSEMTSNVKLISLKNGGGKKHAIEEGISQAQGTLIVTTDADCEMGEKWLSVLVAFYETNRPKMIAGPVLLKDENNFLQRVQYQEMTVLTACTCASMYHDSPLFCSGANLAYEKEAFLSVNGFQGVDGTATGDDVFLMLKFKEQFPGEIKYLRSKDAAVYTRAEPDTSSVLEQRKRWASKTFSYGTSRVTWVAVLVFTANFLVLMSGILSVINVKFVLALVTSFFAKFLVDFMLLHAASSFFGKRSRPLSFLIASLLYPLYVTGIGSIAPFTNYSWKGRVS